MFCKSCGKEMNDDAAFCNNCGTPAGQVNVTQNSEKNKKEDNVLRLEVKPTFDFKYQILHTIWRIFLALVFLEIFFLNIVWALINAPAIGFGIIGIVSVIYFIKMFFEKAQYKHMSYKFYKTKVEYIDGFLNKEEKQLKYEHIREVVMSQNILERMCGLGKIRLYTNATSGYGSGNRHAQTGKNGIYIHCVKDLKENLQKIKDIIDELED